MATIKKNYKSDFDAILHLVSCVGDTNKEIGWPDYDWAARFYTSSHDKYYIASNYRGVLTNCFNDNGNIHVVFNNHGLPSGTLRVEFSAEIPNDIYPDGSQLEVSPLPLNIELVRGRGDCGTIVDVDVMLSYIKGDKGDAFTYDDFTTEQKTDLIAPIKSDIDNAIATKQDSLTTTKDLSISASNELSLTNRAKLDWLISQWNDWCLIYSGGAYKSYGKYNEETGYFELNGITDIGLDEAKAILAYAPYTRFAIPNHGENRWVFNKASFSSIRTIFPLCFTNSGADTGTAAYMFNRWTNLKTVQIATSGFLSRQYMFNQCKNLRSVIGLSAFSNENSSNVGIFNGCTALQEAYIYRLTTDLSLAHSPLLTIDSIKYIVEQRYKNNALTITLHPDTYAKVTDELFALAAEKKITLAST